MDGRTVAELAPTVYARVPKRTRLRCTVEQALHEDAWARDVGPDMTKAVLNEYLMLWTWTMRVVLNNTRQDEVAWSWETNGTYSTRSAYAAKFWGREVTPTAEFTWKSKAPLQCRFFAWLATQNRCWTSDHLARRGLDLHERCPLCNQEEETIDHLLLHCVFAREVWTAILHSLGKPEWLPAADVSLSDWCTARTGTGRYKKTINALFILVMWEIWKHRNAVIFDGATPSKNYVIHVIANEGRTWQQAGLLKGELSTFFSGVEGWANGAS